MESKDYQRKTICPQRSWQKLLSWISISLIVALPGYILIPANSVLAQREIAQSPLLSKNTIYVNPEDGDDSNTGKKSAPLQTITQALRTASPGSTIQLTNGTYSETTGETFPLIIKDGIMLRGDVRNQGYKTIIKGDGYFISPTGAGQNVAIAAVKGASGITGITVTNNHSRGHGIWIESASPQIISNTLTRNGNTGVSVNGNSSPTIEDNYFYNNSGNGLLVYGTSQPEITNNTFEQTGFGISLVQNSRAKISDNMFDGNRIGIILEGNAQGTLRENEIVNSGESGLTAIAQARVDLGTDEQPGNNIFRSNKKLDIQNATEQEIIAVGTEVNGDTQGKINFDRGTFVANNERPSLRDLPPLPSRRRVAQRPMPQPAIEPPPANLPAPPPVIASNTGNKELIFTPNSSSSRTVVDVEPVPFPPQFKTTALNSNSSQVSSLSDVLGGSARVKYKVLVEVLDSSEEREVRSLYPEAFKTIYQGEPWLQVGAFSQWDKAKRAEQNLIDLGLGTYLIE
ncbi:MAG: DUF1565 domain-containing protein [Cyanobacteria bacterium J06623_7]